MTDFTERRRHHRFMALLEVHVVPGDRIPVDLRLTTIDIAAGGARCAANHAIEQDVRLQLTITLVGGTLKSPSPMDVDAVVQRCTEKPRAAENRRYELALEFVRIDPQDRKKLVTYLNDL